MNLEEKEDSNDNLNSFVLDPLSVIVKLAILSKKKIGCKILIYNNVIYLNEIGIFQSIVRYTYNSNKNNLQYLYNPIELACKKFLNKDSKIKNIFINAQKGLENLIETYKEHSIITHTLYLYYNIIANYLAEIFNSKLFIRDNFSDYYSEEILNKLNSIWNASRINVILNMLDYIDKDVLSEKSIKCLEEFIDIIDEEVKNILK